MATADTIKQYFVNILQRDPTAAETAYWVATVDSSALTLTQARDAIAGSGEAVTYVDQIVRIYQAAFGRKPDVTGINGWTDELRADATALSKIAAGFVNSTEWKNRYGDNTVNDAVLQALYVNVLGRVGSADEIKAWKDTGQSMTQILIGFSNSAEFTAKAAPSILALKQAAGDVATSALNTVYTGTGALFDPSQQAGQTYTLTTAADNIIGTAGNDTVNGVVSATAGETTMTLADTIDGGAGTDVFNLLVSGAGVSLAGSTIKNVENFFIKNLTGSNTAHDFANVTGAQQIWSNASVTNFVATGIQNNVALGLKDTATNYTATFKDGTFAAGSTVTVVTSGAGTSAANSVVTVGHAATAGTADDLTLAVQAASGKNYIEFANGGNKVGDLKTVTVSGTGSVAITDGAGTEFNNVTTVNASANSGGVTFTAGANNKDLTVTGGSGNDKFTLTNFDDKDKVDGGAGKDTVSISLANAIAFTKAAQISNVEVLEVTGATGAATTLNADFFGVSNFVVDGVIGHNVTLTNLANNATVQLNSNSGAAVDLTIDVKGAIAGTSDTLTLTTDKSGADLATNAVTVKAGGVETINIVTSSESGAGAFTLGGITDAQLTTINISGKGAVDLGTIAAAAIKTVDAGKAEGAVTVDASNSTAAVSFTGGSAVDTYTASSKGDTIYAGKGADAITLGAGNDILVYKAASDSTAAAKDVIGGFNITADLVKFDASLQKGSASYLGAAAFTNTGATQLRMNGADLEVDFNGDGTLDFVVTLTGVTSADFGAANFTFAA